MNFDVMVTDVRSRLVEPTTRFFTVAEVSAWINQGYHDLIGKTGWCERVHALPAVANQYEYSLPSDIIHVKDVWWQEKYKLLRNDLVDLNNNMGLNPHQTSNRPYIYCAFPWDKKIRLYAAPSAASAATTVNVGGGISASITTIPAASTTSFPTMGRIKIENEQILYFAKNATTFLQCVRGDGYTTAATHADTTAISNCDLGIFITYDPPDLTGTDAPRIASPWHAALVLYAAHIGLQKADKWNESRQLMEEYLAMVDKANLERQKENQDRYPYWRDEDDYSSFAMLK